MANKELVLPTSKIELRKLATGLTAKELRRVADVFAGVAEKLEAAERQAEIKAIRSRMKEHGIDPTELGGTARKAPKKTSTKPKAKKPVAKTKGKSVPAKYRLKVGKTVNEWTGRGRMPVVFREHVEAGGDLQKLLIK